MRKSFWLFAIVLSMSLGIRVQAAPREIPDHFNTGVDTDTELTEIPEPGFTVESSIRPEPEDSWHWIWSTATDRRGMR